MKNNSELNIIPFIYIYIFACIIFSIASSAIGIKIINENPSWKDIHKNHFNFLIANLIIAIIAMISAVIYLIFQIKKQL